MRTVLLVTLVTAGNTSSVITFLWMFITSGAKLEIDQSYGIFQWICPTCQPVMCKVTLTQCTSKVASCIDALIKIYNLECQVAELTSLVDSTYMKDSNPMIMTIRLNRSCKS